MGFGKAGRESGAQVEQAMEIEVQEMTVFLTALDEQYAELRKTHYVAEVMTNLAKWSATLKPPLAPQGHAAFQLLSSRT